MRVHDLPTTRLLAPCTMTSVSTESIYPFYKAEGTFTEWGIRFDKTSKPHHWTTLELHLSGSDSENPRALLLSVGASRAAVWVPCRERARVGERHLPRSHVLHTMSVRSRPTVRDAVTRWDLISIGKSA